MDVIEKDKVRLLQIPFHLVEACILSSFLPKQYHWCCKSQKHLVRVLKKEKKTRE
jgi:hypothetical protein